MSKKLIVAVLSAVLLIGGASTVLAATNDSALNDIKGLYNQIFGLQQQIIDKQVEAGVITEDQADLYKKNLEARQEYRDQAIESGQFYGPGQGCGGAGYGMMGGGYGRGMRGYGSGLAPQAGVPAQSGYNY